MNHLQKIKPLNDEDEPKARRVMEPMLQMHKLDLGGLTAAYNG